MGKYIKLFNNHSQYETFIGGGGDEPFVKPNVSHCIEENHVHYNPYVSPLIVTYNVTDATQDTKLWAYYNGYTESLVHLDSIVINGVTADLAELDGNNGYYSLTEGEHTVEYIFKDKNILIDWFFDGCSNITSVVMPDYFKAIGLSTLQNCENLSSIKFSNSLETIGKESLKWCKFSSLTLPQSLTTIGSASLGGNKQLTSITIPSNVTFIGHLAFSGCTSLSSVILQSTVPPTLEDANAFSDNASGRKFYVPSESVEAYKAASGWSQYSDNIQAIA